MGTTDGKCLTKVARGAYCESDVWCQSGLTCTGNTCVAPGSVHNWGSCLSDSECIGGNQCWNGTCRCPNTTACTNDLGADYVCNEGTWLAGNTEGQCVARVGVGGTCENDGWCQTGLLCDGSTCYQPGTVANWQSCTATPQCANSGTCFDHGPGVGRLCHCSAHSQCPGGYCDLGSSDWSWFTTDGKCGTPQPLGAYCESNEWCQSGLTCEGGVCIAPASKHNWESCSSTSECIGGNECWNGQCRCRNQTDCTNDRGAGWYCDEGTWLIGNAEGQCHPKLPDTDAPYCESAAWCQSGNCDWSGRLNRNICWSHIAQPYLATCNLNGHCASWSCNAGRGYICDPLAYTIENNVRAYCEDNAWCQSGGSCLDSYSVSIGNVCVAPANRDWGEPCDHNMQCGAHPGLYCAYWPFGGCGVGRCDIGVGYYCGY